MARVKKTDQAKNDGKTAKNAAQEPETEGQTEDVTQETEALERAEDAAQRPETEGQTEDVTQETEALERAEDAAQKPETEGQTGEVTQNPVSTNVKTNAEAAAAIEAAAPGVKLKMNESGEITITEPETDIFAKLPNPCVYCGPSVKGVARQYTTYQGGIPDALRNFITEHPEARQLIVSTPQFPAMRRRLDTPGTAEAKLYKRVKAQLQK